MSDKKIWKVSVTPDDIATGIRGSRTACPVARAVGRLTRDAVTVNATAIRGYGRTGGYLWGIAMPESVVDFIIEFDSGKVVKPFTFCVAAP